MADVYLFNFRAVLVFTAIHEDVLPLRMTVEVTINLQNTFLDGYGKFFIIQQEKARVYTSLLASVCLNMQQKNSITHLQ